MKISGKTRPRRVVSTFALPSALLLLALLTAACTGTGRLREGERLYAGAKVKTVKAESEWKMGPLKSDLKKSVLIPRPNRKLLWMRPKLAIYNTFHNRREKSFGNFIAERFGEAPVLYNPAIVNRQRDLLRERAANDGAFRIRLDSEEKLKRKTARVRHRVTVLSPRAIITDVRFVPRDSGLLTRTIRSLQEQSLVKAGNAYRLEDLMAERQRIADTLRNRGWYYFSPDMLLFEADTVTERGQLSLALTIKPDVTERDRRRYRLGSIRINPNYDLGQQRFGVNFNDLRDSTRIDSIRQENRRRAARDTFHYDDCLIFTTRQPDVRPQVLADQIFLHCGDYYSNNAYQASIYRLLNLNLYKFINIRFEPSREVDTVLNARIQLTPFNAQRVEASAAGVFSPGFYGGVRAGIAYTHRNAFRGAEALRLSLSGAYLNTDKDNFAFQDFWVSDASAQLTLPRFVGLRERQSRAFNTTRFTLRHEGNWFRFDLSEATPELGLSFQRVRAEAGYIWKKDRRGSAIQEFNPLSLGVQYATVSDRAVKQQLIAQIPQDQTGTLQFLLTFVEFQPNYTFTLDERLEPPQRHTRYFRQRFAAQASGYLRSGGDALPRDYQLNNPLNLFWETDYRQYQRTHGRNILAARLAFAIGQPLKKGGFIALLDRYAIGGASSVRAFAPRSVGPGATPRSTVADGGLNVGLYTGNLLIESSLEYRFPIGRYPELAVFVDAGNVWLTSGPDATDVSRFRFDRFYRELASGFGVGFRVNLGFFVLRLDVATPLSKPFLPAGQRWVLDDVNFGNRDWRRENLNWNFSFGYPF